MRHVLQETFAEAAGPTPMMAGQPDVLLVALTPATWPDRAERAIQHVRATFAVSRATSLGEAVQQARAARPTVALIRARGWGQREAEFIADLHAASPRTALCLVTAQTPDPFAIAAGGVRGWLWQAEQTEVWLRALRALASGGSWLLPLFASWMLRNLEAERVPLLREMEILRRIRQGEQYGEIAALLAMTPSQVKLGVRRALDAVIDILNRFDDGGYEASGDRAPRPRPNAPGSLTVALPLPHEPPPPLHAVSPPIDQTIEPDERGQRSA